MRSDFGRRAFSLLEICVVLAIIIMLSALVFAAVVKRERPARSVPAPEATPAPLPAPAA